MEIEADRIVALVDTCGGRNICCKMGNIVTSLVMAMLKVIGEMKMEVVHLQLTAMEINYWD